MGVEARMGVAMLVCSSAAKCSWYCRAIACMDNKFRARSQSYESSDFANVHLENRDHEMTLLH